MDNELLEIIKESRDCLSVEAVDEIMHFYNHNEYEMALEGFLIEIIRTHIYLQSKSIEKLKDLCVFYGLDKESVFDYDIWNKFEQWCNRTSLDRK